MGTNHFSSLLVKVLFLPFSPFSDKQQSHYLIGCYTAGINSLLIFFMCITLCLYTSFKASSDNDFWVKLITIFINACHLIPQHFLKEYHLAIYEIYRSKLWYHQVLSSKYIILILSNTLLNVWTVVTNQQAEIINST